LQLHAVLPQQAAHALMMGVDPLRATLDVLPVDERRSKRPSTPADACTRFDQLDVVAGTRQTLARGEAGEAGTDNDDLQDARQPPASVDAICEDESPDRRSTE